MCRQTCRVHAMTWPRGRSAVSDDEMSFEEPAGPELARAALEAARGKAAGKSKRRRSVLSTNPHSRRSGYTGAGPDARDPQPFGRLLRRLVSERGWEKPAAEAQVIGNWEK